MTEKIICGDALEVLKGMESESVDCVITSPPYFGLRDYDVKGQIGLEPTLEEYLQKMLAITAECQRVLKKTGTLWWNHGDSYGTGASRDNLDNWGVQKMAGSTNLPGEGGRKPQPTLKKKPIKGYEKCLLLQAHRLAIRMVDEQKWILRNIIIWHKPNCMPSSVDDRFTVDYEPVFFFSKSKKYFFERQYDPVSEVSLKRAEYGWNSDHPSIAGSNPTGIHTERMGERFVNPAGRNRRSVWKIPTHSFQEAHFATFPEKLIEPMILAGCPKGGTILDPFSGAATTGVVAKKFGRNYIGIELNPAYVKMSEKRLARITPPLF
jgi:site-specific DNA-methyltransferase (adenine-specific)